MMERQVYIITCGVNGKQYVGQTNRKIEKRIGDHFHNSLIICCAIKKYGIKNFLIQTIRGFDSQMVLDETEINLIANLNTLSPYGYNLKDGGNGGKHHEETKRKMSESRKGDKHYNYGKRGEETPRYGKRHSKETKRKMRKAHIGKSLSEETKKRMSESQKGERNHNYGKKASEETRRKISKALKGEKNPMFGIRLCGEKNNFYGKKHSEETRKKMRESWAKRKPKKEK